MTLSGARPLTLNRDPSFWKITDTGLMQPEFGDVLRNALLGDSTDGLDMNVGVIVRRG